MPTRSKPNPDLSAPIRLEPGDNITASFHLWRTLASPEFGTESGPIIIRGSAHAVGRRRATRSPRRRAWKLPADAWTVFRDFEVTPQLRVFRELWRHNYDQRASSSIALLLHRDISERLAAGATHDELNDYLVDTHERENRFAFGTISLEAHWAFNNEKPIAWHRRDTAPRKTFRQIMKRILWRVQAS
jgi:hypothetical protein